MTDKALEERYAKILDELPESYFAGTACEHLSKPFLVSGPIDPAARKVMVIGRECGWNWDVPYEGGRAEAYIPAALKLHRERFERWMERAKMGSGATFFGFMQALACRLGSRYGLIYSNLFCFDFAGGDPRQAKRHYEEIVEPYSARLLNAQIEHFQPDLIIFANGIDSRSVRKKFFPHEEGVVQGKRWSALTQEIPDNQLWEFQLYGKYRCLRIHHPSSYSKGARRAREYLISNLPALVGER
jgi:hypothetical protein